MPIVSSDGGPYGGASGTAREIDFMGLGAAFLSDLGELKRRGLPTGAKLIEIGAQQLSESLFQSTECLQQLGDLYGTKLDDIGTPTSDFRSAPRSSRFWRALGFDYSAIDLDGSPEALAIDCEERQADRELATIAPLAIVAPGRRCYHDENRH